MKTILITIELFSHNFSGKPVPTFPDGAPDNLKRDD
jgi:hypothetical protein